MLIKKKERLIPIKTSSKKWDSFDLSRQFFNRTALNFRANLTPSYAFPREEKYEAQYFWFTAWNETVMIIIIRTRRRREPQVDGSSLDWWCQGRQWLGKQRWRSGSPATVLQGTAGDTSLCKFQRLTQVWLYRKKKTAGSSTSFPGLDLQSY